MSIADVSGLTLTIEDGRRKMTIHKISLAQCDNCRLQTYHNFASADVDYEEGGSILIVSHRTCELCDTLKTTKIRLVLPKEVIV